MLQLFEEIPQTSDREATLFSSIQSRETKTDTVSIEMTLIVRIFTWYKKVHLLFTYSIIVHSKWRINRIHQIVGTLPYKPLSSL